MNCVVQFVIKNYNQNVKNNYEFSNIMAYHQLNYIMQLLQSKDVVITQIIFHDSDTYSMNIDTSLQKSKHNESCVMNFFLTLESNSIKQFSVLQSENNQNSMYEKCDQSYKFTLIQHYDTHDHLESKKIAWIKNVYDYYLCYYFTSLLSIQRSTNFLNENPRIRSGLIERMLQCSDENHHFNILHQRNNSINNTNNNNNNEFEENIVEVENNRDWLDHFYVLSRIVILFSIVYFYSSPSRFIVVTVIGFLIYLYHIGFFRGHPILPAHDNRHLENNNDIVENNANQPPVRLQVPDQLNNTNGFSPTIYNLRNQRRHSVLNFIWIFLSSFFASLVPEQANNV